MEMDKERFLSSGLLEQYALGLTNPQESKEVEQYLEVFPELKAEVEGMRKAIEQYALEQAIPPSPHLKRRAMKSTGSEDSGAAMRASAGKRQRFALAAGTALIFLVTTMILYQQMIGLSRDYRQLSSEYALFRQQCEQKNQKNEAQVKLYAFLKHAGTRPVQLRGTALAPEAEIVVYWNEQEHQAYLNPVNLPEPPAGKQYQVWADVNGKMINMGLLEPRTSELQNVSFIDHAESLNITVEPAGGSSEPTVAFLLANGKV